jgi:hypothetical protein
MLQSNALNRNEGTEFMLAFKPGRRCISVLSSLIMLLASINVLMPAAPAKASTGLKKAQNNPSVLSPVWGPNIRQWDSYIAVLSSTYGLDPDLIAAVIREESNGDYQGISRAGAVGLMGVMPSSPGLEWRPQPEELLNPGTNMRWGVAILSDIMQQAGGDPYAALAAYSGGWEYANSRVPRQYAASVLDYYARAVIVRNGLSPDIASRWTIAVEMRRGHVPNQPLLVLGTQPVSGLRTYGQHTLYRYIDERGRAYHVEAYAVPVALVVPVARDMSHLAHSDWLEPELQARLGKSHEKIGGNNPRVLLACLPSLSRLRGRASTRWFAPSYCPSWHR